MSKQASWNDNYIDVAERIVEFREKYAEGSLQQVSLEFKEVDSRWWVIYTAAAYRTPDDARPGHGTAWEPIPGKTNFTRDSEVQNAETAAWGRAIVAVLAADTKRGIASAQEARQRPPAAEVFIAARQAVKVVWEETRGPWSQSEAEAQFSEWSGGARLVNADADVLNDFADHLKTPRE